MHQMEEAPGREWKGKAKTHVRGHKADKVWPLIADFCSLSRWFPTPTCIPVEGVSGQPDCVRFCAGFKTPADQNSERTVNSYVAKWRVVGCGDGCEVDWGYEVEPAEGWTLQQLDLFASSGLQVMGKRVEADLTAMKQALTPSNYPHWSPQLQSVKPGKEKRIVSEANRL